MKRSPIVASALGLALTLAGTAWAQDTNGAGETACDPKVSNCEPSKPAKPSEPPEPPGPRWPPAPPMFVPPQPAGAPLRDERWKVPVPMSRRGIVLPARVFMPTLEAEFGAPFSPQGAAIEPGLAPIWPQSGVVSFGASMGIGGLFEFGVEASVGLGDQHQLQPHGRLKLFSAKAAEIGLEFALATEIDARTSLTTVALRPSLHVPIWFHLGNIARIETGVGFSAYVPTDHTTRGYFALTSPSNDPTVARPAVPLALVFSPFEVFYLGIGSGFGVRAIEPRLSGDAIRDGVFAPLNVRVGGTFVRDAHPIADLEARLDFPYAFLAAPPTGFTTEAWRLGMSLGLIVEP